MSEKLHAPLVELTIVRLKEFLRETEAIFWVFVFPLLLTLALGFAFRDKAPDKIPIGVVDGPHAQQRQAALAKSPALLPRVLPADQAKEALRRGKVSLLVEEGDVPVYHFDPTRPEARTARVEADDALQGAAGRRDAYKPRELKTVERGSRYVDFLVPGLLAMNLMGTGMWSIGFSIVNARLKKLLKRFVATPMRKGDFLIAQFLARLVFLILEVGAVLVFARLVFDVEVRGSLATLALICILGGAAFAGLGMLVGSRARTVEAVSGMMNVVMMPMWICSGIFFSYERFPDMIKPVIRLLPLTALADALRAVINDGAALMQVFPQVANLTIWMVLSYAIALRIFRWQ